MTSRGSYVRPDGGGFSLVELLVLIALLAVLIAITLPALSGAREATKRSRSLSLQRQLQVGMTLYADAHAETLPYMGTPGDPFGPIVVRGVRVSGLQDYYWAQSGFWISIVVPEYCDPSTAYDLRGRIDPSGLVWSHFRLTHCAFADPKVFSEWAKDPPNELFRPTRLNEIVHPSRKGLILDGLLLPQGLDGKARVYATCFADGSARAIPPSEVDWERVVVPPTAT
jgi:type II secretory pathway pseudopilin PulG